MSKRRKTNNDSDSDDDSVTAEYGSPDNKDNTMPRPKSLSNDELAELKKQDEYNKLSGVTKRYPKTKNTLYARQFTPVGLHDKSPRGEFNRFFKQRYKINDPQLYEAFQGIPPPEERLSLPPTMDSIIHRKKSYSTNKDIGDHKEKKSNFFPKVKIGGRRTRRGRRKKRTRRRGKSRRKSKGRKRRKSRRKKRR